MAGCAGTPCRSVGFFSVIFRVVVFCVFTVKCYRSNTLRSAESFLQQQPEALCHVFDEGGTGDLRDNLMRF